MTAAGLAREPPSNEILLPVLIDQIARDDPSAPWIEFPADPTSYDAGYQQITYSQFANAINGLASWLEGNLGRGENGETLCYIGPNDPLYGILIVAAVKAGYKMLLLSPRNTLAGSLALMDGLECNAMLVPDHQPPLVQAILTARTMRAPKVPSLQSLLTTEYQHYPYRKSYLSALKEPLVALHTSGSTGLPKPLILNHQWVSTYANVTQHRPPPGYESGNAIKGVRRVFSPFPFFHAAGVMRHLLYAVFNKVTFILPLSGVLPTAAGVVEALRHTSADELFAPPTMLEELYHSKSMLDDVCSKVRYIVYAGGALPKQVGDELSGKIKILSTYGSSELGELPQMVPAGEWPTFDSNYIQIHNCFGADFRHHSQNLYELVLKKSATAVVYQPPFSLFPDLQEFPTRDLFSPHPSKPGLWAYEGRSDDLIVFLTGLKVNPLPFEHIVTGHVEIRSALMAGNQRLQPALLLEPVEDKSLSVVQRAQFIERVWPLVEEANKECPAHAQILKTHIMIASPEKPFKRAGKGTIQRTLTVEMYSQELDALYTDADQLTTPVPHSRVQNIDEEDLTQSLVQAILKLTGWKELSIDDNLFLRGMDSLQVLVLTRELRRLLCGDIAPSTIYANFTARRLTGAIQNLLSQEQNTQDQSEKATDQAVISTLETHKHDIDRYYEEFSDTANNPKNTHTNGLVHSSALNDSETVLIIGSTGALGSNMLSVLLTLQSVSHVYCLNRAPDSGTLQSARNKSSGLSTTFPDARVTFVPMDLTSPNTNFIPPSHHAAIASTVTLVIHAAWPVDFNLPLESFSSSLTSVSSLASLAASSRRQPSIIFISSIASVLNYSPSPVPEAEVTSLNAPDRTGYGQSKYIAEQLLAYAARQYGMRATIIRLGQVSGPAHNAKGKWTSREWLPSLVLSSKFLRKLPSSLGGDNGSRKAAPSGIDWMPIDELAEALIETALWVGKNDRDEIRNGGGEPRVLNMRNPNQTTWSALIPAVTEAFEARGEPVSVVEYSEWLEALERSASATLASGPEHMARVNPAIRLLEFFEKIGEKGAETALRIDKAMAVSPRLGGMGRVDGRMMRRWVEGWMSEGG